MNPNTRSAVEGLIAAKIRQRDKIALVAEMRRQVEIAEKEAKDAGNDVMRARNALDDAMTAEIEYPEDRADLPMPEAEAGLDAG